MTALCKYVNVNTNLCELAAECNVMVGIKGNWCIDKCCPNNKAKQIKMLSGLGIILYGIPSPDIDLLEWIKEQAKGKKISINKSKPCKGCGSTKNIIKGFGRLVWHRISKGKKEKFIIERAEICNACEHRTFLNAMEWGVGFIKDGDLPINHEPGEWDALWCSKCKCCIEAKIRVKDEMCILDKWEPTREA